MEQKEIAQQIAGFYKKTYETSLIAMNTIQEQTERMLNLSLVQSPWLPEQSRNLVSTWAKAYSKGCDDFKTASDAQFRKFEAMLHPEEKVDPEESARKRKSI
jgi:hypothetical protein